MAIDTTGPRTRRAILTGALGAVAATVASAVGRPTAAMGASGDIMYVGTEHVADTLTQIDTEQSGAEALIGNSDSGNGLVGHSSSNSGVHGDSVSLYGVRGTSGYIGVCGRAGDSTGVLGYSGPEPLPAALGITGVYGHAAQLSGVGVQGRADQGVGVFGDTLSGTAMWGNSDSGMGVYGVSHSYTAIWGRSSASDRAAIFGESFESTGVYGFSGIGPPTRMGRPETGVLGRAEAYNDPEGVRGEAPSGRGGVFKGGKAQLRLVPSTAASHPSAGQSGDLFLNANKRLWFCKGATTWVRLV